jgi:hypothetical protein
MENTENTKNAMLLSNGKYEQYERSCVCGADSCDASKPVK